MILFVHEFVTKSPVDALNKWVAATSAGIGVWTQIRDHPPYSFSTKAMEVRAKSVGSNLQ